MNWIEEKIPDEDILFTRINQSQISKQDKKPRAEAFLNTPYGVQSKNLSSDWNKYCQTPEECRKSIAFQLNSKGIPKDPNSFYIWQMNVGRIRNEIQPIQEVKHNPIFNHEKLPNNRAHSLIIGRKTNDLEVNNAEFRSLLIKVGEWAIAPK